MHKRTRIPILRQGSTPSRSPILSPITAPSLAAFTHPRCKVLGEVVRHPATGAVMVANGCIALRLDRGPIFHDDGIPVASPTFVQRLDALPWTRFHNDAQRITPAEWRGFDSVRGLLYQHGLEELWIQKPHSLAMTKAKPIWTAQALFIPLAILQLVARLPRVELRIDGNHDFALIRFAGGEGIIANRYRTVRAADIPPHIFSLFHKPAQLPGGFT